MWYLIIMKAIKCENCGDRLVSLFYREWDKKKKKMANNTKIKQMYCRKCKMPTEVVVLNWFKEDK